MKTTLPAVLTLVCSAVWAQERMLDAFSDVSLWQSFQSAGVRVSRHSDAGSTADGLRLDIDFAKGSGYGGVFRHFDLPLPADYRLTFMMRAQVPVNTFEVKISDDSSGENIWWVNTKDFSYPAEWKEITLKRRHFAFAWGPRPSAHPARLRRIEFVVTAGTGGTGSVWIDDLRLEPVDPPPAIPPDPLVAASSAQDGETPENILPGRARSWASTGAAGEWIEVDYGYVREFGGLRISWDTTLTDIDGDLMGSRNGSEYERLYSLRRAAGGDAVLYTPEAEARFLRLKLLRNGSGIPFRIHELSPVPPETLATRNAFAELAAAGAPRGLFPRYVQKEGTFWTVVGVRDDAREALFGEDGALEVDKQRFSLEPFVRTSGGEMLSWDNAQTDHSLALGYLPVPTVRRTYRDLVLTITPLAVGEAGRSSLLVRYVVVNRSPRSQTGSFYLAVRPFQVNPSYQWLNTEGGVARVDSVRMEGNRVLVDGTPVVLSRMPSAAGAAHIDAREIARHIASGRLPRTLAVADPLGMASGAVQYLYALAPGDSLVVIAAVPLVPQADRWQTSPPTLESFVREYREVVSGWERKLNAVALRGPAEVQRLFDIVRSTLAYVLINRDGHGIQPGSRSYERSWIRDGSMTSSALLKFGIREEVRDFVDWYASHQYDNGAVPCVVDRRGPDPVPEHDSHGQLIFACMEYFRFTNDTLFLRSRWNNIVGAVNAIQRLRAERMTPEYSDPGNEERRAYYGLLTESISHEGYSAKPMHSHWDNFFALKGFKDAAAAARVLGDADAALRYDSLVQAFRQDLYASIGLSMKLRRIDYIPGCVELGDFDPTSTSVMLFPGGEFEQGLQDAVRRTFDTYYEWFVRRSLEEIAWEAFTPYEVRNIGTYIYLGQKNRGHHLADWFLRHQHPSRWNQWAEVVWSNARAPRFIGDMPHTWVGSDFINAVRAMFAFERDDLGAVVIGAGLKPGWIEGGIEVKELPTHFGSLTYSAAAHGGRAAQLSIAGTIDARRHPLLIPVDLLEGTLRSASVNGNRVLPSGGFVVIDTLPAKVILSY